MSPLEALRMAWRAIGSNRLRSALTILGLVIGVAAVIALVSLGRGASGAVSQQIQGLGSNLIILMPRRGTVLPLEEAAELAERVGSVAAAVPVVTLGSTLQAGGAEVDATVEGVAPDYLSVRSYQLAGGRFLEEADLTERRPVIVLGAQAAEDLFGGRNPLGQPVQVAGQSFTVVGVLRPKGASGGQQGDAIGLVPVTLALRLAGRNELTRIDFAARSPEHAPLAVNHLEAVAALLHPRSDGEEPVRVLSQEQILTTVQTVNQTFTTLLAAIAAISLLVGGIGIMNIMLVSVAERTREIGVRKALGARRRDVLQQFLFESLLLSLAGGLIGIAAGLGVALGASRFAGWPAQPDLGAVWLSFGFAAAVGLFFGVYPAVRAANLDPIEALRRE